jgi:glycerophosphoryl diester phosphodiesterase
VNVEIKSHPSEPGFDEARSLAGPVLAAVRAWGGTTIVSSFDARMVDRVRELDAEVPTAQLTVVATTSPEEIVASILRRGHGWWHPWVPTVDAAAVAAARAAGVGVNTWTTDDPARIVELAAWGVDGVVTNDVTLARTTLGRARGSRP